MLGSNKNRERSSGLLSPYPRPCVTLKRGKLKLSRASKVNPLAAPLKVAQVPHTSQTAARQLRSFEKRVNVLDPGWMGNSSSVPLRYTLSLCSSRFSSRTTKSPLFFSFPFPTKRMQQHNAFSCHRPHSKQIPSHETALPAAQLHVAHAEQVI